MEDRENINDEFVVKEIGSDEMEEIIVDLEDEENKENVFFSRIFVLVKRSFDSFKFNRFIDGQLRLFLVLIILFSVVIDLFVKKKLRRSVFVSFWLRNLSVKRVEKVVKEE